ncbi:MAG: hypothetical protein JOZ29_02600 [Deltaproteobacteria bacterium]|nr:hypothetical protein [Deltaproteobacteria bacterium]
MSFKGIRGSPFVQTYQQAVEKNFQQPASPSVVSPASGRELKEGSHLSGRVLRPICHQMPLVSLSQHPTRLIALQHTLVQLRNGCNSIPAILEAILANNRWHFQDKHQPLAFRERIALSSVPEPGSALEGNAFCRVSSSAELQGDEKSAR